ncbi:MAG: hypothetical protein AB8G23_02985 [Myxococcota bacterium]
MVALFVGWSRRGELDLSPSDGLGYALGIAGLVMMVLLLGYSLRKRMKLLRGAGSLRTWFEIHLILGLLGPTLILYHSDFGLGSANASISLACVLVVSGSGVGGRFLYGRMHRGLAGERRSVEEMVRRAQKALPPIESELAMAVGAESALAAYQGFCVGAERGLLGSFRALLARPLGLRCRMRVLAMLQGNASLGAPRGGSEEARAALQVFTGLMSRAAELRLFERLFALWHAVHIPLTIILFISAAIHVIAVHLY